ncbi:RICIN domain-containing protein [Micromonospora sp. NPDC000089]|uniref:RICIN domain-containing protein n=1 Tax=unclassified Micromonospora TaxID=2617518 RepID=UPI00369F50CB
MKFNGAKRLALVAAALATTAGAFANAPAAQAATPYYHLKVQHSGKVISATPTFGGSVREGNPIVQVTENSLDHRQQWEIMSSNPTNVNQVEFVWALRDKGVAKNGTLVKLCIDSPTDDFNQANNSSVVIRPCDGTASQKWVRDFGTFVSNKNKFNLKQWAVLNASQQEGAPIIHFNQDGGPNHKFAFTLQ